MNGTKLAANGTVNQTTNATAQETVNGKVDGTVNRTVDGTVNGALSGTIGEATGGGGGAGGIFRGGLTPRALLWGAIGSFLLTASSMYVAMRLGALPWPTIFASIAAMSILKVMGNTNIHEINVTQTAMTAGAMIAGGLAFTMPGLWTQEQAPSLASFFLPVFLIALAGLILGLLLTWFWRPMLLEREKLPFPVGMAAAETIKTGDAGGRKAGLLGVALALSAVFTLIRDWFQKIPPAVVIPTPASWHLQLGVMLYPMAPAIGYMIGSVYTVVMFCGGAIAYLLLIPLGTGLGFFPDGAAAEAFKNTLGLGLMVGAGLGTLLRFFFGRLKNKKAGPAGGAGDAVSAAGAVTGAANTAASGAGATANTAAPAPAGALAPARRRPYLILLVAAVTVACCAGAGMSLPIALFVLASTTLMTLMSCLITGETGLDPMEIFGIIVMMGCAFLFRPTWQTGLLAAAVVAVASGFAGDTMFDYRAGQILGTDPKAQLVAQALGGLVGAAVASLTLFVVIGQFGPVFEAGLPAPQASLVLSMVNQAYDPRVFWPAALLGAALCAAGLPTTTLGIGIYLPFAFSFAIFIGGIIRFVADRFWPGHQEGGMVFASGIFGGESLTGVLIAFLSFFTTL
ncbi:MAG: OPT/YSL family transporter [Peptococcaceae bacterium]|nr:OPT/YSL family transporter [Peptococcaceae bacterium]